MVTKKYFCSNFIEDYLDKAKEYLDGGNKRYPIVFFSGVKSLRWGVTLPEVNGISHSAVQLPDGVPNDELHATALAMAVMDAKNRNDGSYKAFVDSMGWCQRRVGKSAKVLPKYIHEGNWPNEYKVVMPVTGRSPITVRTEDGETYFSLHSSAVKARDKYMEEVLTNQYDDAGSLAPTRAQSYRRELVTSAFTLLNATNDASIELALAKALTYASELVENGDKKYGNIASALSDVMQMFEIPELLSVDDIRTIVLVDMDILLDFAAERMHDVAYNNFKYAMYIRILKMQGLEFGKDANDRKKIDARYDTLIHMLAA